MGDQGFLRVVDSDLDEPLTLEMVAEAVNAPPALVSRLVRMGLLETIAAERGELLLPTRSVVRLRRMRRLHRDLGVNFTGASVILDLVARIEELNREVAELRSRMGRM